MDGDAGLRRARAVNRWRRSPGRPGTVEKAGPCVAERPKALLAKEIHVRSMQLGPLARTLLIPQEKCAKCGCCLAEGTA